MCSLSLTNIHYLPFVNYSVLLSNSGILDWNFICNIEQIESTNLFLDVNTNKSQLLVIQIESNMEVISILVTL